MEARKQEKIKAKEAKVAAGAEAKRVRDAMKAAKAVRDAEEAYRKAQAAIERTARANAGGSGAAAPAALVEPAGGNVVRLNTDVLLAGWDVSRGSD